MSQGEIILYQPDNASTQLEVRIENETVWLTQAQMVELFNSSKQNIISTKVYLPCFLNETKT